MKRVCEKCGGERFKTVVKGKSYACRKCGTVQLAVYAQTRTTGNVRVK